MSPDDKRHGTYAGAVAHRKEGSPLCAPCRAASAAYMREWRKGKEEREKRRNRARWRAVQRLIDSHREDYERLCIEERLRDQEEFRARGAKA